MTVLAFPIQKPFQQEDAWLCLNYVAELLTKAGMGAKNLFNFCF